MECGYFLSKDEDSSRNEHLKRHLCRDDSGSVYRWTGESTLRVSLCQHGSESSCSREPSSSLLTVTVMDS